MTLLSPKPLLFYLLLLFFLSCLPRETYAGTTPSYDCTEVKDGSIERLICNDEILAQLDMKLSQIYLAASKKAIDEQPPMLKTEQRGWIKGRNDCWKEQDQYQCIKNSYRYRIAELQARYKLIGANGPFFYICNSDPANEVTVTYFQTEPPTLIAERGDQVSLMYRKPSASGTKYQGRNESLWEHHGNARIIWGFEASEIDCQKK